METVSDPGGLALDATLGERLEKCVGWVESSMMQRTLPPHLDVYCYCRGLRWREGGIVIPKYTGVFKSQIKSSCRSFFLDCNTCFYVELILLLPCLEILYKFKNEQN